jgi:hypothetical protein
MKKKGQAAMEFLMTYGWAILAAIIVIGVIAIYFRPSTLTTEQVIVTAPFYGVGAAVGSTTVDVEIRNNGGETLDLETTPATLSVGTCTGVTASVDPMTAGSTSVLAFTGCTLGSAGDSINADISISYKRPSSSLVLTSTGTVTGTVG